MIAVIGEFDGFHVGHKKLLLRAADLAAKHNVTWGIITFSPYPSRFFDSDKKILFTEKAKAVVANFLGIPKMITLRFDGALRDMECSEFLEKLRTELGVTGIVIGEDFKFGKNGTGNAEIIKRFCPKFGMACLVAPTETIAGTNKKLSSSSLRIWCAEGELDKLKKYLGFPYPVRGHVVRGDGRGSQLGYPTANISAPEEKLLPGDGAYAVSVLVNDEWKPGAAFIGTSPTFGTGTKRSLEVHVIGFSGNLYDKEILVFFEEFLRAPQKFERAFELVKSISTAVRSSTEIFQKNYSESREMYEKFAKIFSDIKGVQIINLSETKSAPDTGDYKTKYITRDTSNIKEIFHPDFTENLNCSLAEAVVRPGMSTQRHIHSDSTEIYYGISGSGYIYIEGEDKAVLTAGSAFLIRAGVPHYVTANDDGSGQPLTFLCFCTPPYTHEQTKLL